MIRVNYEVRFSEINVITASKLKYSMYTCNVLLLAQTRVCIYANKL